MAEQSSEETIPGTLEQIKKQSLLNAMRLERLELGHRALVRGQDRIAMQMAENTKITSEVKDLLTAGRIGTQFIKWTGIVAGAMSAIWIAVYQIFHHGKTPGG
jgi:hypothetical protein